MKITEAAQAVKDIFGNVEIVTLIDKPEEDQNDRMTKFFRFCKSKKIDSKITHDGKDSFMIFAIKRIGSKNVTATGSGYTIAQSLDDIAGDMKRNKMI